MLKGHLLNASDGPHFFMHDRLHMNSDRLRHLVIPYVNKTDEKRNRPEMVNRQYLHCVASL